MRTVLTLAIGKLRYHRSRTLLTGMAIFLTTALLTAVGTSGIALFDMNRQMAVMGGNSHAALLNLSEEQIAVLGSHAQVEAVTTFESVGTIVYEKMNGSLYYKENVKNAISGAETTLVEGRMPDKADEICAAPAFLERMGAEPKVGVKMDISFRIGKDGEMVTQNFTVSGIMDGMTLAQVEQTGISDNRLHYSALVSKAFVEQYAAQGLYEPVIEAYIRVYGEEELTYPEITEKIDDVAKDIGINANEIKTRVSYNKDYLYTMTDPGTETVQIVALISLIIILFSALVIYSIYYVGVITDVQEIGKLKAIGASKGQIRHVMLCQGGIVSVVSIPLGLAVGYFLVYFLYPVVIGKLVQSPMAAADGILTMKIHMFSLPLLLVVAAASLVTVYVSLLKPMRMAAKISPIDAIRYQEGGGIAVKRKGHHEVKVSTLVYANLTRNRKRTIVTMLTMGLSCVLFMCVAGVMSSMSEEDIARRQIPTGSFSIDLEYSADDTVYPENNLDSLVQKNYFSEDLVKEIYGIEGVEQVTRNYGRMLASVGNAEDLGLNGYDENRVAISYITREDMEAVKRKLKRGDIDYDRMSANNEICFANDFLFDSDGLEIGDVLEMTLYDGDRQIPFTATLSASADLWDEVPLLGAVSFVMTKDTWDSLGLSYDATTNLYIDAQEEKYDAVKEKLQGMVEEEDRFRLYSLDEEMQIGRMGVRMTKYPVYLILILIAVIGFMNLINTMITSVMVRKKELGILQAVGLSGKQLAHMLSGEGMIFALGTLALSVTLGNASGYLLYRAAKESGFMSLSRYHYPVGETILLLAILLLGQWVITFFVNKKVAHASLIEWIRSEE